MKKKSARKKRRTEDWLNPDLPIKLKAQALAQHCDSEYEKEMKRIGDTKLMAHERGLKKFLDHKNCTTLDAYRLGSAAHLQATAAMIRQFVIGESRGD